MGKTKVIGFLLTFTFLGLVLWKTDLSQLGQALSSANYLYIAPALLCTLTSYLLRTVRWRRILRPARQIRLTRLFPVLMIGFMANNILPARLGEFVRAFMLGRKESLSKSLSFSTIMLERLLDGITLVSFLLLLSIFYPLPGWGRELEYIAGIIFLVGILGVVFLLFRAEIVLKLLNVVLKIRPLSEATTRKLNERAEAFIFGLASLRKKRTIIKLLAYSVLIWSVEASMYFLVLRAFNVNLVPTQMAIAAVMLLVVVNLGIMLPSAPGYIGTFQFFAIQALSAFGVSHEVALSIAIVAHGVQYVLVTGLGLLFFWHENMSFSQLQAAQSDDSDTDDLLAASASPSAAPPTNEAQATDSRPTTTSATRSIKSGRYGA